MSDSGPRILLVCDAGAPEVPSVARRVRRPLTAQGYFVQAADDMGDAEHRLSQDVFPLLIVYVPSMAHCPEAVQRLLSRVRQDPALSYPRVLLIDGKGGDQIVAREYAASDVPLWDQLLNRWFHANELRAYVRVLLERKRGE
jgi:DNA-binding response OmpR family regulator